LALEGGGTRCQAALFDAAGQLQHTADAGPVNTNFVPVAQAEQAVQAVVRGVLAAAVPAEAVGHLVTALVAADFGPRPGGALPMLAHRAYGELVVSGAGRLYRPHGSRSWPPPAAAWACAPTTGAGGGAGRLGLCWATSGSAYAWACWAARRRAGLGAARPAPTDLVAAVSAHFNLARPTGAPISLRWPINLPLSRAEMAHCAGGHGAGCRRRPAGLAPHGQSRCRPADLALHAARRLFQPDEAFAERGRRLTNAGDLLLAPLADRLAAEFPHAALHTGREAPAVALGRLALHDLKENLC
jgi:hypothetical protein